MVSVPTYPLMLLFIEEARSKSLLISMDPLSPPGVGVLVVKSSKNPLLSFVELRLNKRTMAAFSELQASFKCNKSLWNN